MSHKYTKEQVKQALLDLKQSLGHEPTLKEIDACDKLPSVRQIQRLYGGVIKLRKELNFDEPNHTAGPTRQAKAAEINALAAKYEAELYNELHKKLHDKTGATTYVIRQYAYQQWHEDESYYSNTLFDVAIDDRQKNHVTLIDFFYPSDLNSFAGCIRAKKKKLMDFPVALYDCTYEVLFVCANPKFHQSDVDRMVCVKNIKESGIKVMALNTFKGTYLV